MNEILSILKQTIMVRLVFKELRIFYASHVLFLVSEMPAGVNKEASNSFPYVRGWLAFLARVSDPIVKLHEFYVTVVD